MLNICFLGLFLFTTVAVTLCHSEKGFERDPYCPACNFKTSCFVTDLIQFVVVPETGEAGPAFLSQLFLFQIIFSFPKPARSPPVF